MDQHVSMQGRSVYLSGICLYNKPTLCEPATPLLISTAAACNCACITEVRLQMGTVDTMRAPGRRLTGSLTSS